MARVPASPFASARAGSEPRATILPTSPSTNSLAPGLGSWTLLSVAPSPYCGPAPPLHVLQGSPLVSLPGLGPSSSALLSVSGRSPSVPSTGPKLSGRRRAGGDPQIAARASSTRLRGSRQLFPGRTMCGKAGWGEGLGLAGETRLSLMCWGMALVLPAPHAHAVPSAPSGPSPGPHQSTRRSTESTSCSSMPR